MGVRSQIRLPEGQRTMSQDSLSSNLEGLRVSPTKEESSTARSVLPNNLSLQLLPADEGLDPAKHEIEDVLLSRLNKAWRASVTGYMPDNQATREIYWKWFGRVLKYIHGSEFDVNDLANTDKNQKAEMLLEFFKHSQQFYSAATLWQGYGSLNTVFTYGFNFNFKTDVPKIARYLSQLAKTQVQKQSEVFIHEQFKEMVPSANKTGEDLKHACAMVLGVYGALRCDEVAHLEFKHFTVPDEGAITCTLQFDTKSGKAGKSEKGGHTFFIPDDDVGAAASIRRLLAQLHHDGITSGRIFRKYNAKKCIFQLPVVGKNTIADYPHRIAKELGLPHAEGFTGHAFRRTSATILADAGSTTKNLMRHGRWRSASVAGRYVAVSKKQKTNTAMVISTGDTTKIDTAPRTGSKNSSTINITNCNNLTLTLNL
jgi:integrase